MELLFPSYPYLITFVLFLFMLFKVAKLLKTNNLPPAPWRLPLIGNIHQLVGSPPHHRLADLAKRYGPLMHLKLGQLSIMVVSNAETAKEIMKTHDIVFASRPEFASLTDIFLDYKDLVFAPYGDYWRQLRKIVTLELLSVKRVESFRSLREEEVTNLIKNIRAQAGSTVNLGALVLSSAISVSSVAIIGRKISDQEEFLSLVDQITKLAGGFNIADLFPSIKMISYVSGLKRKAQGIFENFDRILGNIIARHREKRAERENGDDHGTEADHKEEEEDLLDVLLRVQREGNLDLPFTDNNIKAVILNIFIGGTETSSTTIEWAMSELLKNPRVMEKAQAEVRQVFDNKEYVDEASLGQLSYLKLVIKETLRLHPPLPLLLPRESRERCEINGYEIPVKTKIIINGWAIGRDPKYWDDAESFIPERFQDSSVDFKGTNFEFIPFGAGRRICPGINFGLANAELPLARMLFHFNWKLPNGEKFEDLDMTEIFGATVRKGKSLQVVPIPYHPSP